MISESFEYWVLCFWTTLALLADSEDLHVVIRIGKPRFRSRSRKVPIFFPRLLGAVAGPIQTGWLKARCVYSVCSLWEIGIDGVLISGEKWIFDQAQFSIDWWRYVQFNEAKKYVQFK